MAGSSLFVCALAALLPNLLAQTVTSDPQINCGACKGLFDELDYLVSKVPSYAKIDTGSRRMDAVGNMEENKHDLARSESFLYEAMEKSCAEMENYSYFEESGLKVYHRYQNRPEQKTPLKLKNFGWSADTQQRLRFACDAILGENEEEILEAYVERREVEYKKDLCMKICKKAKMEHQLNPWYGLDITGKKLSEFNTEYVDGKLNAEALKKKNQIDKKLHELKAKGETKYKKKKEAEQKANEEEGEEKNEAKDEL
eukprot:m.202545 g.202545  ORF g.202545 m.202545 type:complete len:256 (+) comp15751_c0_seq8:3744-4511(+)